MLIIADYGPNDPARTTIAAALTNAGITTTHWGTPDSGPCAIITTTGLDPSTQYRTPTIDIHLLAGALTDLDPWHGHAHNLLTLREAIAPHAAILAVTESTYQVDKRDTPRASSVISIAPLSP